MYWRLSRHHGFVERTAKSLGIRRMSLWRHMRRVPGLIEEAKRMRQAWTAELHRRKVAQRKKVRARQVAKRRARRVEVRRRRKARLRAYYAAKHRAALAARYAARRERMRGELLLSIERTGARLDAMAHELGLCRLTIIRWIHRLDLWAVVDATRAKRRERGKRGLAP